MQYEVTKNLLFEARYVGTRGQQSPSGRRLQPGLRPQRPLDARPHLRALQPGVPRRRLAQRPAERGRDGARARHGSRLRLRQPVPRRPGGHLRGRRARRRRGRALRSQPRQPAHLLGQHARRRSGHQLRGARPRPRLQRAGGAAAPVERRLDLPRRAVQPDQALLRRLAVQRGLHLLEVASTPARPTPAAPPAPASPTCPTPASSCRATSATSKATAPSPTSTARTASALNFVYQTARPSARSNGSLNGWQLSGFFQAQTGTPYSIFAPEPELQTAAQYADLVRGSGGLYRLGFGRPALCGSLDDLRRQGADITEDAFDSGALCTAVRPERQPRAATPCARPRSTASTSASSRARSSPRRLRSNSAGTSSTSSTAPTSRRPTANSAAPTSAASPTPRAAPASCSSGPS